MVQMVIWSAGLLWILGNLGAFLPLTTGVLLASSGWRLACNSTDTHILQVASPLSYPDGSPVPLCPRLLPVSMYSHMPFFPP